VALEEVILSKEQIITGYFLNSFEKPPDQIIRMSHGQNDASSPTHWELEGDQQISL
jgi:hypothetical protein